MSKCPKCGASDYYVGITSQACSSHTCELYEPPGGTCLAPSPQEVPELAGSHEGLWDGQMLFGGHRGGGRSELLRDACKRENGLLVTRAVSPTPLSQSTRPTKGNDTLHVEVLSQLQSVVHSLQSTHDRLEGLRGNVAQANETSMGGPFSCLSHMLCDLDALRTMQRSLQDNLAQLDQCYPRQEQSGDPRPSGSHKSEDTCQKDKLQCRVCQSIVSTSDPYVIRACKQPGDLCILGPVAIVSSSRSQSCETQSPEHWQDYADCTYQDDAPGFEKGLSLLGCTDFRMEGRELQLSNSEELFRRFQTQPQVLCLRGQSDWSVLDVHDRLADWR